MMDSRNK